MIRIFSAWDTKNKKDYRLHFAEILGNFTGLKHKGKKVKNKLSKQ